MRTPLRRIAPCSAASRLMRERDHPASFLRTEVYVSKSKSEVQVSEASQKESRSGGVWVGKNGGTGSRRGEATTTQRMYGGDRGGQTTHALTASCSECTKWRSLEHGASTSMRSKPTALHAGALAPRPQLLASTPVTHAAPRPKPAADADASARVRPRGCPPRPRPDSTATAGARMARG